MIADDFYQNSKKKKRPASAADILARQPPFDLEAEMGVIGSVLLMPEVCDELASLRADDFYDDANRIIYQHLRDMHDDGGKIDVTLLVLMVRMLSRVARLRADNARGLVAMIPIGVSKSDDHAGGCGKIPRRVAKPLETTA